VSIFFRTRPPGHMSRSDLHGTCDAAPWTLWLSRWKGKATVTFLAQCDTIESFWQTFNQYPITALKDKQHLHVFRLGVSPMWEDPSNACGGHMKVTIKNPEGAVAVWLSLVLHMVGEQMPPEMLVNGLTFVYHSVGFHIIKVWLGTIDKVAVARTKKFILAILDDADFYSEKVTFVPHKLVLGSTKRPEGNFIRHLAPCEAAPL